MAGEVKIVFMCPICKKVWGFIEQFSHNEDDIEGLGQKQEIKVCPQCKEKNV